MAGFTTALYESITYAIWCRTRVATGVCLLATFAGCGGSDTKEASTLLVGNTRGNNVVRVDRLTGMFVSNFIEAGSGGLTDPDDLTHGPDGHLYVSSGGNTTGQILRYNGTTGAFMGVFA